MALTSLAIIAVAYWLGLRERHKIEPEKLAAYKLEIASGEAFEPVKADWRMWFNAALTLPLMVLLILEVADLLVLFMVAFVIALLVNIRSIGDQQDLIKRQAANAVPVMILVLAAGVFTGIMTDSGMIKAMADAALAVVPDGWGNVIPLFTAILALPLGFFMSNDAYWFGVVPVLAESAAHYGIPANEIARAGGIGQVLHMMGPTSAPCGCYWDWSRPNSATSRGTPCAGASLSPPLTSCSPWSPAPSASPERHATPRRFPVPGGPYGVSLRPAGCRPIGAAGRAPRLVIPRTVRAVAATTA